VSCLPVPLACMNPPRLLLHEAGHVTQPVGGFLVFVVFACNVQAGARTDTLHRWMELIQVAAGTILNGNVLLERRFP